MILFYLLQHTPCPSVEFKQINVVDQPPGATKFINKRSSLVSNSFFFFFNLNITAVKIY
jgi:hypothetical protein